MADSNEPTAFDAPLHIGAVSLVVRDLDRVLAWYRDAIGLEVQSATAGEAVLGAGPHALLRLIHDPAARLAGPKASGLFHTAFLVPSRRDLARWLTHAAAMKVPLEGASDHIVSEALYLTDPEGNGIEIYADRPRSAWQFANGQILMDTLALDIDSLMSTLRPDETSWTGIATGTRIGHVHLKVGDTGAAEQFYDGLLGFATAYRRPGASWMGSGGYHHHVAANSWMSRGAPPRQPGTTGLTGLEIIVKDAGAVAGLNERFGTDPAGHTLTFVPDQASN
jgi:catechol 2,3-dioxygenase